MSAGAETLRLRRADDALELWIHVTPRAKRTAVGGTHGDALRVAVQAPPAEGAANAACVEALADALGLRRAAVSLDPSAKGRRKKVRVSGEPAALERRLRALAAGQVSD